MGWILDIIFIIIIVLGILFGVRSGFVKGICKLAGTILAIAVAITFCNSFQETLELGFGLTSALAQALNNEIIAGWLAIAISFIILFLLVKIGAWLLGKIGTALVEKVQVFSVINRFLGGLLGLIKAAVFIFLLLTLCKYLIDWANLQAMHDFIKSSTIVGAIFEWEWFIEATTFSFLNLNN